MHKNTIKQHEKQQVYNYIKKTYEDYNADNSQKVQLVYKMVGDCIQNGGIITKEAFERSNGKNTEVFKTALEECNKIKHIFHENSEMQSYALEVNKEFLHDSVRKFMVNDTNASSTKSK